MLPILYRWTNCGSWFALALLLTSSPEAKNCCQQAFILIEVAEEFGNVPQRVGQHNTV